MRFLQTACSCLRVTRSIPSPLFRNKLILNRPISNSSILLKKNKTSLAEEFEEDVIEEDYNDSPSSTTNSNSSINQHSELLSLLKSQISKSSYQLKSNPPSTKSLFQLLRSCSTLSQLEESLLILKEWRIKGLKIDERTADVLGKSSSGLDGGLELFLGVLEKRNEFGIDLESKTTIRFLMRGLLNKLNTVTEQDEKLKLLSQSQQLLKLSRYYLPTNFFDLPTLLLYLSLSIKSSNKIDYEILNLLNNQSIDSFNSLLQLDSKSNLLSELKESIKVILQSVELGKEEEDLEFKLLIQKTQFA